jgi:hypothetical protein
MPPQAAETSTQPTGGTPFLCKLFLKQIIICSFTPTLTAKEKAYCKMGQDRELPYALKLLKHSKDGLTKFHVSQLYCVGLLGKCNAMYAKASCDFIAGAVIDGERMLVRVECKARVTPATHQRECCHNEFLFCFHATSTGAISNSTGTELYTVVSVSSSDFHCY